MEESQETLALNICHVRKLRLIINRLHTLLYSTALLFLFYYRVCFFFFQDQETKRSHFLSWILVFASEILLSFIWILGQAYRWRPVSRTVFPERLPEDEKLPAIDVFICTADPVKEPTVGVMNTVLSAMALDYPPQKLHVYLSDDGGSDLTLLGMKEAWKFARWWLPFCRKYRVKCRCPKAFFSALETDDDFSGSSLFMKEKQKIKEKYEAFVEEINRARENRAPSNDERDQPSLIEEKYEAFVEEINRARENRAPSNDERDQPSLIEEKYEAFVEEINRARENRAPSNDERDQPSLIEEKYEAFVEEINRARENRAPSNDERDQPSLIEEKYEAFVEEINRARENRAPSNDERDQPSLIEEKYEAFVEEINRARENRAPSNDERDQPSLIEEKYEAFVEEINRARENRAPSNDERDQPSLIEVIQDNTSEVEQVELPLLVYVSREKRPSRPHHFKAGALNVLHRVSGVMSNSPYILVLDCDMFCNDPSSARQAMCFHLDSKISPSLAFVQFPQKFHNVSKNDLYDSQMRSLFTIQWQGMDGLNGPVMSGTGFYIKRASLCRKFTDRGTDLMELRQYFGSSNEFIKSLNQNYIPSIMESSGHALLQEARLLASCNYEIGTKWGQEVGFLYDSVVEDYLTGFILHCNGWNSVFCEPSRPQFLGTAATNLNDVLIQGSRWSSGLFENGISKYLPLIYGPPRMSLLQSMCFAELTYYPLYCLPLWCFATIPQLALIHGTPLYPKVSDPYFLVLVFIFVSALTKHLVEVLISGGTVHQWINEERIWMIKSVTCHSYGCLDAVMKKFGIREANFLPTNKVEDDDQTRLYQKDKFDFRASNIFLVPMFALLTLNICCFTVGAYRVVSVGNWDSMLIQLILSTYIIFLNYPVLVGLVFRRDKESISFSVALLFAVLATLVGLAFCELSTLKECVK